MQRLSIIIPTLNEEACLASTLRHVLDLDPPAWEVIVVDGQGLLEVCLRRTRLPVAATLTYAGTAPNRCPPLLPIRLPSPI